MEIEFQVNNDNSGGNPDKKEYGQEEERREKVESEEDGNVRKAWIMVWGTRKECYGRGGGRRKANFTEDS